MKLKDYSSPEAHFGFPCPGCGTWHVIPTVGSRAWGFNGDVNNPTFTPSILDKRKLYGQQDMICHMFVKNGQIEFLEDCTHDLKGRTVTMSDLIGE